MEAIKIGSTIPAEKTHNIIEKFSNKKSLNINYEAYNDRFEYTFTLDRKDYDRDIGLYIILANFVLDIIINFYSEKYIYNKINKSVKGMDDVEKSRLVEEVSLLLVDRKELKEEKESLKNDILDYLIENNRIIIDGYLIFRPRLFDRLLDKAIEKNMKKMYSLVEHNEYIQILQFLMDTQYSQVDTMNLVIREDKIHLLDMDNEDVENEEILRLLKGLFLDDINETDIILSTLLALAPKNIIVHIKEDRDNETLKMLKEVFRDRMYRCNGCKLCK